MKIGVFGGLFDPPHVGHLIIAQAVLEEFNLKKIIFVPAGNPPHKFKYSPFNSRYKMTELAIANNKNFSISDIEMKISGKTYTVNVIRELKNNIKGEFYLIIGSDQWLDITTWKNPAELLKECKIIVVSRPNYRIKKDSKFSKKILTSHTPLLEISSTLVREKIKKNFDVRYLVPDGVYQYIKNHRLYR